MLEINLDSLAAGALGEQFQEAAKKVLANMLDPNTPYKNKRGITIKLTFEQNESRDDMVLGSVVETKLVPQTPIRTNFMIGKDIRTGELYLQEYGKCIRGQVSMEEYRGPDGNYSIDGTKADPETGATSA